MSGSLFPFHMSVSNKTMYNPGNKMVIIWVTNDADNEKYRFIFLANICDGSNLELSVICFLHFFPGY